MLARAVPAPLGVLARDRSHSRASGVREIALIALGAMTAAAANADTLAAVNQARLHLCQGRPPPLVETRALDAVAGRLAGGATLHAALTALPLHPAAATAIHLLGVRDDREIATALANRYCADLSAPELREVGIAWSGQQLYIVAAAPLPVPTPGERASVEREVLRLVNLARAVPRRCGRTAYAAAAPLVLSSVLTRVAADHSAAMASRDDLQHNDPDSTTPAERVRRADYAARVVGENIAAGVPTPAAVVAGWLDSPGHCANIMDRRFTEMGVAYALARHSSAAIYWTQLLAIPGSRR